MTGVECGSSTSRDRANLRLVNGSLALWGLAYGLGAVVAKHPDLSALLDGVAPVALVGVSLVVVGAFVRFLRGADELQRLVELRALATALAVAFVALPVVRLAGLRGGADSLVSDVPLLAMAVAYGVASIAGRRALT